MPDFFPPKGGAVPIGRFFHWNIQHEAPWPNEKALHSVEKREKQSKERTWEIGLTFNNKMFLFLFHSHIEKTAFNNQVSVKKKFFCALSWVVVPTSQ